MWDDECDPGLPHTPAKAKKEVERSEPVSAAKTAKPATPSKSLLRAEPEGHGSWAKVAKRWAVAAKWPPQADSSPLRQSPTWLISGDAGLGCLACQRQPKLTTPWAQVTFGGGKHVKSYYFERHSNSSSHIAAVAAYLQLEQGPSGKLVVGAPSLDEFQRLAALMAQGQQRQFKKSKSFSDRTALMQWCISECLAENDRSFLRKAVSISLCRDARRQRLLIRFGAASDTFGMRAGVLGVAVGDGDSAGDIVAATRKVLTQFCTQRWDPPRNFRGEPAALDSDLFQHITDRIEIVTTDAAANEILATDIGRGRRDPALESELPQHQQPLGLLTPNLLLIGRDHAHAFRRPGFNVCCLNLSTSWGPGQKPGTYAARGNSITSPQDLAASVQGRSLSYVHHANHHSGHS